MNRRTIALGVLAAAAVGVWVARAVRDPGPLTHEEVFHLASDARPRDWLGLVEWLAGRPDGEDLAWVVVSVADDRDPWAVDPLVAAYLRHFPDSPRRLWWVRHMLQRDHSAEARAMATRELAAVGDADARRAVLRSHLYAWVEAGKTADLLDLVDPADGDFTLRTVADWLARPGPTLLGGDSGEASRLAAVLAAHRARFGEVPWSAYCDGRLAEFGGQYAEAAVGYQRCLDALPADSPDRKRVSEALLNAFDKDGRWLEGYRTADRPEEAFAYYRRQFNDPSRFGDLDRLMTRHAAHCPTDPTTRETAAYLHYIRGEHKVAARLAGQGIVAPSKYGDHWIIVSAAGRRGWDRGQEEKWEPPPAAPARAMSSLSRD